MTDSKETIIRLSQVRFGYANGPEILSGVDLSLEKGDRVGLVGPNGAGKSTLFFLVMGLLQPDSGQVEVYGSRRRTDRDFREVRRRIGLLFQNPDDQLFCPTVIDDVAFGPLNLGWPDEKVREACREALDLVGLAGFDDRVTYRLSAGEMRLVSLAAVLAMRPEALLLDEPAAGLDQSAVERVIETITERIESYVIVSHDGDFLEKTTSRTWRLENGCLRRH